MSPGRDRDPPSSGVRVVELGRLVRDAIDALGRPDLAEPILDNALRAASLDEIPNGAAFYRFVLGPLSDEVRAQVGPTLGEMFETRMASAMLLLARMAPPRAVDPVDERTPLPARWRRRDAGGGQER